MSVVLLRHTPDPERVVAIAGRICYSPSTVAELEERFDDEQVGRMIAMLLRLGHTSPLEHVSFTFGIEASRACLNQLVRHRIASYSQQSQRYVRADSFPYVIPPTVQGDEEARAILDRAAESSRQAYARLLEMGIPKEDARYVLPMGTLSRIVATFNARSLHNLFRLRCCERAQWEIRGIAREMLDLVRGVAPRLFAKAGPMCETHGTCPEGDMSCGRLARLRAAGKGNQP
ncbi:MAG: FAD-dependent thymidylate synthase [Firmicutes bacterium RBG_13_65_8]|nr:MAG: FAD-dependent thymidylate synthase [Firmicutes bacterium RBG_13_65_8]